MSRPNTPNAHRTYAKDHAATIERLVYMENMHPDHIGIKIGTSGSAVRSWATKYMKLTYRKRASFSHSNYKAIGSDGWEEITGRVPSPEEQYGPVVGGTIGVPSLPIRRAPDGTETIYGKTFTYVDLEDFPKPFFDMSDVLREKGLKK